jgi:hypothetical protein
MSATFVMQYCRFEENDDFAKVEKRKSGHETRAPFRPYVSMKIADLGHENLVKATHEKLCFPFGHEKRGKNDVLSVRLKKTTASTRQRPSFR